MIGIARRIDQLGRVVVPAEFRKSLGIDATDELEMRVEDGHLEIFKVSPACALCAGGTDLMRVNQRFLCNRCAREIRSQPGCACCQRIDSLREVHGKFLCETCVNEFVHV
jgi:transcriptional pleiotropic regulator of transition state genes